MATAAKSTNVAKRKISFFECLDGMGNRVPEIDFKSVLDIVNKLNTNTDARFTAPDGDLFHARVFRRSGKGKDLLIVARTRASGWPEQELKGVYSEPGLATGANLAEPTHVGFFAKNVVALMRGREGPFAGRVEQYLMDKVDFGEKGITLRPLLHPHVAERMTGVDYVRRFTMKLPTQQANRIPAGAPTLRNIFQRARQQYGNAEVEVTIKVPTKGADREATQLLDEVRAIMDANTLSVLEKANMTYVDPSTEKGDDLDFLSEKLSMTVEVELKARTRIVTETSASDAVTTAYDALEPTIRRAIGDTTT